MRTSQSVHPSFRDQARKPCRTSGPQAEYRGLREVGSGLQMSQSRNPGHLRRGNSVCQSRTRNYRRRREWSASTIRPGRSQSQARRSRRSGALREKSTGSIVGIAYFLTRGLCGMLGGIRRHRKIHFWHASAMRFDGKIEQQPHIYLGMSDVH